MFVFRSNLWSSSRNKVSAYRSRAGGNLATGSAEIQFQELECKWLKVFIRAVLMANQ